ncbi:MAG: LiaF domain-containing protein [Ignavibacteriaceae bacterium]
MEEIKQENHRRNYDSRSVVGLILVVLGSLFLLDSMNVIDFNVARIIFSFPAILMIIGVILILNTNRRLPGAILLILGIFFMIPRIFPWVYYDSHIIFPILLIAFGIYIILRKRTRSNLEGEQKHNPNADEAHFKDYNEINADTVNDVAIFGGGHKIIVTDNFKGGNITSIFGGSEIDLRESKLAPGTNVIDIVAVFGGSNIIVPTDWKISIDVLPIFGGFSNKVRRDPDSVIDTERTLLIKGFVLFGGGEVKS